MTGLEFYTVGCVINAVIICIGYYLMSKKGKTILNNSSLNDKILEINKTLFMIGLSWIGLGLFITYQVGYQSKKHLNKNYKSFKKIPH